MRNRFSARQPHYQSSDLEESVPGQRLSGDNQTLVVAVTPPGHGVTVTQRHVAAPVVMELEHPGSGDLLRLPLLLPGLGRLGLLLQDAVQAVRQVASSTLLLRRAHLRRKYVHVTTVTGTFQKYYKEAMYSNYFWFIHLILTFYLYTSWRS